MKLCDVFKATGPSFPYYPSFCHRFKISVNACVLLCHVGWKTYTNNEDGWGEFSVKGIADATGLSEKEQANARKALKGLGLLEDRYARLQHLLKLRVSGIEIDPNAGDTLDGADGQPPKGRMPPEQAPKGRMASTPNGGSSIGAIKTNKEGTSNAEPEKSKNRQPELVKRWVDRYNLTHKDPCIFRNVDGIQAARLLKAGITVERVLEVSEQAWQHPDWFWCKQATSLATLAAHFNDIAQELEHPPVTQGYNFAANRNGYQRMAKPGDEVLY